MARRKTYPLTEHQRQLFYEWQLRPESAEFNIALSLKLEGVDVPRLRRAVAFVSESIDPFRIRLRREPSGDVVQDVYDDNIMWPSEHDCRDGTSLEQSERNAERAVTEFSSETFAFEDRILARTALFRYGEQQYLFALCGSHLLGDAMTMGNLIFLLTFGYNYPRVARSLSAAKKTTGLGLLSFDAYERKHRKRSQSREQAVAHWRERMAGAKLGVDLRTTPTRLTYPTRSENAPRIETREVAARARVPVEGPLRLEVGMFEDPKPGGMVAFRLKRAVCEGLRRFNEDDAGERSSTAFLTLASLYQFLLYRYSGQDDIVVRYPANIRPTGPGPLKDIYNFILPGYYVNTIPLRTRIDASQSFLDLIAQNFANTKADREYRWLPYGEILKVCEASELPQSHLEVATIGATRFDGLNLPLHGCKVVGVRSFRGAVQGGLALLYEDCNDGCFAFTLEYDRNLLSEDAAVDFCERFAILADRVVATPGLPLRDVSLAVEGDFSAVAGEPPSREQPSDPAQSASIPGLFRASVARDPDAIALVLGDRSLTYADLDRRSNRLANLLLERFDLRRDQLVAVGLERSVDMIVAVLAVLKAGAAYVPLDPHDPRERLAAIATDLGQGAAPAALITHSHLSGIRSCFERVLTLDEDAEALQACSPDAPDVSVAPSHLAYAIYTSGSTGVPKGVLLEHGGVISRYRWTVDAFELSKNDVFIQRTPSTFDPSVREFFWPLFLGARLVLVEQGPHADPRHLGHLIAEHGVTIACFVPELLDAFLAFGDHRTCPTIRTITCGGEALRSSLAKRCKERFPTARFFNMYGPTEATIFSTAHEVREDSLDPIVPIGAPVAEVRAHVLDRDGHAVAPGVAGELHLSGTGLARGYLHRPQRTRDSFVTLRDGETRAYRTGDLVRSVNGCLDFLGRTDDQVKVRGYRIELGEITSCLRQHPAVASAASVTLTDPSGSTSIVAFFSTSSDAHDRPPVSEGTRLAAQVLELVERKLPGYMVPDRLFQVPGLPRTSSGKVDARTLRELVPRLERRSDAVPPRNAREAEMRALWAQVLEVDEEQIGVHDDFFALGGHSSRLMQLQARLCAHFETEIPLRALYERPTIAGVTAYLRGDRLAGPTPSVESDARWAPACAPGARTAGEERQVLLTGATGFLGVHLLSELLTRTSARVHCIVRGDNAHRAGDKLNAALRFFGLEANVASDRIALHLGDLKQPNLGLSPAVAARLQEEIDAVYHNGAQVHHLQSYGSLRPANVEATRWLLEFALERRKKTFHYVSTRGVVVEAGQPYPSQDRPRVGPPLVAPSTNNGYVLSKWVCENMLWNAARTCALPVSIYRLGLLAGQSGSGTMIPDQYHMAMFFKGALQLGAFPDSFAVEMTPVDLVAESIVALSRHRGELAELHDLHNPAPLTEREVFAALEEAGRVVAPMSLAAFRDLIAEMPDSNAYAAYRERFLDATAGRESLAPRQSAEPVGADVHGRLRTLGVRAPDSPATMLRQMLSYWLRVGFVGPDLAT